MKLPKQAKPVTRANSSLFSKGNIALSVCHAGIPSSEIGTCFFDDGPSVNGFNCAACCAQRHAVAWLGPVSGAINC